MKALAKLLFPRLKKRVRELEAQVEAINERLTWVPAFEEPPTHGDEAP